VTLSRLDIPYSCQLLVVFSAYFLMQGAAIIAAPFRFYLEAPGVAETGPFNPHFVVDVGVAFLVSGVVLAAGVWRRDPWLATAGAAFPALHAVFHVYLWVAGGFRCTPLEGFEFAAIVVPAILAVWASLSLGRTDPRVK